MCRLFNCKLGAIAFSLLLSLMVLIGFPTHAEAAKVAKAIAFDPGVTAVNVATIYETSPTTQKATLKSLKNKAMKKAAGFSSSALLQSEDGTRVISISQWKDLASYQAFIAPPVDTTASKETKKEKAPTAAPLRTVIFEVEKAQTAREGLKPAVKGKEAVVEFSEFKLKNAADKDKVVANAEKLIPATLLKQPAPQSVILLDSTSTLR